MMGTGRGSGKCHLVAVAVSTRWMIRTTRWCLRRDWKAKRRLFHPLGWKWAEESPISISRSRARVFQLFHQRRRKMRRCVGLIAARTKNERALHLLRSSITSSWDTGTAYSRIADLIPIRLAGKKSVSTPMRITCLFRTIVFKKTGLNKRKRVNPVW